MEQQVSVGIRLENAPAARPMVCQVACRQGLFRPAPLRPDTSALRPDTKDTFAADLQPASARLAPQASVRSAAPASTIRARLASTPPARSWQALPVRAALGSSIPEMVQRAALPMSTLPNATAASD
jgi:hypothetical protein